jgi:pimeloyl-ACP methyl ester carboxylesterase
MKQFLALLLSILAMAAQAELLQIPTGRGSNVPVYWDKVEGATATVVLLQGGDGVVAFSGPGKGSKPKGNNFLTRSFELFAAQKVNVAVMGTITESGLTYPDRVGDDHLSDVATVAQTVRGLSAVPVWLVGTSRGTVSATAAAIRYAGKPVFDGIVLTSAIVGGKKPQAVPRQSIDKIRVPVLVYMHVNDGCSECQLSDAKWLIGKFKGAPVQAFMAVQGGGNPTGDPCHGSHYHGFIGMESQAVADIVGWINNPVAVVK